MLCCVVLYYVVLRCDVIFCVVFIALCFFLLFVAPYSGTGWLFSMHDCRLFLRSMFSLAKCVVAKFAFMFVYLFPASFLHSFITLSLSLWLSFLTFSIVLPISFFISIGLFPSLLQLVFFFLYFNLSFSFYILIVTRIL